MNKAKHHEFSPSKLDLFYSCPASYRMQKQFEPVVNEMMTQGTKLHEIMESGVIPEELTKQEAGLIESAFEKANEIMDYGKAQKEQKLSLCDEHNNEITNGTVDILSVEDGYAVAADYKFGGTEVSASSTQCGVYAGMILQAHNVDFVQFHIVQPLIGNYDMRIYEANTLGDIVQHVKSIIADCTDKEWTFDAGDHCKFCDAKEGCPVYQSETGALIETRSTKEMTIADVGRLLPYCGITKKRIRAIEHRAKELLHKNAESIPGWELQYRKGNRKVVCPDKVYAIAKKYLSHDEIMKHTKMSVSKLEKAVVDKASEQFPASTKKSLKQSFRIATEEYIKRGSDREYLKQKK